MRKVPDIRHNPELDYDCAPVCIEVVLGYHGIKKRGRVEADPEHGMPPELVDIELKRHGLDTVSGTMSVGVLRALTKGGFLVLTPIQYADEGHWVVVNGVGRGRVYYHCPDRGQCSMPFGTFEDVWTDETSWGRPFVKFGISPHPR